jgi:hypothetical protein
MPSGTAWAAGAAGLLAATLAQAQSSACETLKTTLAARIEATGVRGYAMDVVPGRTPVPSGAKVIGNCDGGAFKVVYWRWASARKETAVDEGKVVAPAPAPAPPVVAATVAVPKMPVAVTPKATTQPVAAPPPAPAVVATPAPAPIAPIASTSAATKPVPSITPATPATASATNIEAVPATDERVAIAAQPAPVESPEGEKLPLSQRATTFITGNWPWVSALLLLPLALWLWAWRSHRSAYDEAGLPRGPKL